MTLAGKTYSAARWTTASTVARAALQLLQDNLPAPGDSPKGLQDKAVRSFKGLVEAKMFNGAAQPCSELVQNLHLLLRAALHHGAGKADVQGLRPYPEPGLRPVR